MVIAGSPRIVPLPPLALLIASCALVAGCIDEPTFEGAVEQSSAETIPSHASDEEPTTETPPSGAQAAQAPPASPSVPSSGRAQPGAEEDDDDGDPGNKGKAKGHAKKD